MADYLISYGVIQGAVLAGWLLLRQRAVFGAGFFLGISFLLFIFLYEMNGWFMEMPHLIWTNVPVWFSIAPMLYLYLRYEFGAKKGYNPDWKKVLAHGIPTVLALWYVMPFYLSDATSKIEQFTGFYGETSQVDVVQILYLTQIVVYLAAGYIQSGRWISRKREKESTSVLSDLAFLRVILATLFIQVVVALAVTLYVATSVEKVYVYYYASFGMLSAVTLISTIYYMSPSTVFGLSEKQAVEEGESEQESTPKEAYSSSSLTSEKMAEMLRILDESMQKQKLYKRPALRLSDLSEETHIPAHHISQSLNQERGLTFFDYVNQYRIAEVVDQFEAGAQDFKTIAAIAEECGFKSQSSFYRIFKKEKGCTPTAYIEEQIGK